MSIDLQVIGDQPGLFARQILVIIKLVVLFPLILYLSYKSIPHGGVQTQMDSFHVAINHQNAEKSPSYPVANHTLIIMAYAVAVCCKCGERL